MSVWLAAFVVLVAAGSAISTDVLARYKRDVDFMSGVCIFGCIFEQMNGTDDVFEYFNEDGSGAGTGFCKHLNNKKLGSTCKEYIAAKSCIDGCDDNFLRQTVTRVLDYGCEAHYDEIVKYTPCYVEHCEEFEQHCRSRCGSMEQAKDYSVEEKKNLEMVRQWKQQLQPETVNDDGSVDVLEDINMGGVCRYLSCYASCVQEPLTAACGADTYNFMVKAINDLMPMLMPIMIGNSSASAPSQCQNFTTMTMLPINNASHTSISILIWTLMAVMTMRHLFGKH